MVLGTPFSSGFYPLTLSSPSRWLPSFPVRSEFISTLINWSCLWNTSFFNIHTCHPLALNKFLWCVFSNIPVHFLTFLSSFQSLLKTVQELFSAYPPAGILFKAYTPQRGAWLGFSLLLNYLGVSLRLGCTTWQPRGRVHFSNVHKEALWTSRAMTSHSSKNCQHSYILFTEQ